MSTSKSVIRGLIFCAYFILPIANLMANGGPIDGSAVYSTGDIVLINKPQIKLLKEDLNFKIEGDYTIVNVQYFLLNTDTQNQKVTYGFPVDIIQTDWNYDLEWSDDYLPKFSFKLDGEYLDFSHELDPEINKLESKNYQNQPYEISSKRRWQITNFTIESKEIVRLEVDYKIKNGYTDWGTSKDFFPSFDKRTLVYDLSPAGSWGNGTVKSFSVSIDYSDLQKNGGTIEVKGLEMKKEEGMYLYTVNNFDLKNTNNLEIEYNQSNLGLSQYAWDHRIDNEIKSIEVTSQLKGNYKKEYLFDGNFNTAWVEGKPDNGINEKIVIELDDSRIGAIGIIAGYTNKPKTYLANNRIKKILIEREVVDYNDPTKTRIESEEVQLKDPALIGSLNKNNFYKAMNVVGDYGEGFMKVRKITITILDTYPGSKYNDTCISEIFLMGY